MADETPAVTPPATETPPAVTPPVTPPAAAATPPTEVAPAAGAPPAWALSRIDALTRQKKEAETRAAAAEQRLAQMAPPPVAPTVTPPAATGGLTQADMDAAVAARVAQIDFDRQCSTMVEAGKKDFPDFETALGVFRPMGGLPPQMVQAVLELGDGHKILYNLSKDPAEAHRILSMGPMQQVAALAKMALGAGTPARTLSNAPAPVTPAATGGNGSAGDDLDDTSISQAEWVRRREAQIKSRKAMH